jgi:putative Ca2+/H+ antiporter (TMEM165/GDT1 family)
VGGLVGAVGLAFATIFLAELGDKTQLATFLFAADSEHSKTTVFLGAASALVVTSAIGVALGSVVAEWISPRVIAYLAGAGFIAIGVLTIARA